MSCSNDSLTAARAALKRHDFAEAIALLDAYLAAHPDDLEAELERGLAFLMAGDEARFCAVHNQLSPRMRAWPPLGGRLRRLWDTYRGVARRIARAAAIVALTTMPLALSGCPKDAETTPSDRQPPPGLVDGSAPPPVRSVDAVAPSALDAGVDAGSPRPDASAAAPPRVPPMNVLPPINVVRPKYGVRLRYRVVRPHYRYGIRKPRTPHTP